MPRLSFASPFSTRAVAHPTPVLIDGVWHCTSGPPFPWKSLLFFTGAGLLVTLPLAVFFSFLPLPLAVLVFLGVASLSTLLFCGLSREF